LRSMAKAGTSSSARSIPSFYIHGDDVPSPSSSGRVRYLKPCNWLICHVSMFLCAYILLDVYCHARSC
jgi:hypothetical protein